MAVAEWPPSIVRHHGPVRLRIADPGRHSLGSDQRSPGAMRQAVNAKAWTVAIIVTVVGTLPNGFQTNLTSVILVVATADLPVQQRLGAVRCHPAPPF